MRQPEDSGGARASEATSNLRLALLVLEGYAYLLLIIVVFTALVSWLAWGVATFRPVVALLALFIGVPLAVTTSVAIRSLFFHAPEPEGIIVSRHDAPALHAMVEEVRRRLRAPTVDVIRIGAWFNASALQLPRAAVFWPRNTLVLGYPLFATLAPDQLRAVVAHELGHLSRAHGRFAVWVYRIRLTWARLMRALGERGATPAYVHWLLRWYAPRLHARSTVIARQQEILADECAVAIAGSHAAAEALVALAVGGAFFDDRFWMEIDARAEHEPDPPRPFGTLRPDFWDRTAADAEAVLSDLLARPAYSDTHPSLGDRLAAVGEAPRLPRTPSHTASEAYLGTHADEIVSALDAQWQATNVSEWRRRHAVFKERRTRLEALADLESPTAAQFFERGWLIEQSVNTESALNDYQLAADQGHPGAILALGRIRLGKDDASGVELVERAIDADPALVAEGCDCIISFYRDRNRLVDAGRWQQRSTTHATRTRMADEERRQVSAFDRFLPHGRSDAELATLVEQLKNDAQVAHGFAANRELRYSTGTQFVLALDLRGTGADGLADRIRAEALVPADAAIVVLGRHDQALRQALMVVPGSQLL